MERNIVIMAGGTGGHVFPGLAVAQVLTAEGYRIQWLGTAAGIEAQLVPEAGYSLHVLPVNGVRGRGFLTLLKAPLMIGRSLWAAWRVLRKLKPVVVLGFGGFAAGPGAVAAKILRSPLVLHEQNSVLGTTNAILQHLANRRLEGFPETFSKRQATYYTGNPVRAEFSHSGSLNATTYNDSVCRVLIVGGSRGARALNEQLPKLLHSISEEAQCELSIVHQCGRQDRSDTQKRYEDLELNAQVTEFIDEMATAYKNTDLLICRAGAMTVAEITNAGVAAALIPFPFAIDDHQTENARWLEKHGAGLVLAQNELKGTGAFTGLSRLITDRQRREEMGANAKALAMSDSANQVAQHCLQLTGCEDR